LSIQVWATQDDIVESMAALSSSIYHGYTPTNAAGVDGTPQGTFKSVLENFCEITSDDIPAIKVTVPPSSYLNMPNSYSYNATYGSQSPAWYPITLEVGSGR